MHVKPQHPVSCSHLQAHKDTAQHPRAVASSGLWPAEVRVYRRRLWSQVLWGAFHKQHANFTLVPVSVKLQATMKYLVLYPQSPSLAPELVMTFLGCPGFQSEGFG